MVRRILILRAVSFVSVSSLCKADEPVKVKDWIFQQSGASAEAWTVNDSGSQLGLLCLSKSNCVIYFIADGGKCDDGSQYPALMNSSSGAIALSTSCKELVSDTGRSRFALVINEFDVVLTSLLKDRTAGIVIPMASGTFKVARFSLEGSNEAVEAVNRSMQGRTKNTSMKDQDI